MSITFRNRQIELPNPTYYLYKWTCNTNGKSYIGMTKNIERRLEQHCSGEGSKPLLQDLVNFGLSNFTVEIIDLLHTDDQAAVLNLEDFYIQKYNSLYPLGYNMRLNADIVPNDEAIDLNNIVIKGKFVFHNESHKIFTIGQFSQSRAYQLLTNIKENTQTNKIQKKKHFNFKYIQLEVNSDQDFIVGQIYDLQLQYKFQNDLFLVTSAS